MSESSARILSVTPEEYHRDPMPKPSLSASIAKKLVSESPLHAWAAHPRLGGISKQPTKAMDAGTLIHRMLLGKGAEIVVIDHDDYCTKDAKKHRDAAKADGKIPVLAEDLAAITEAAGAIKERLGKLGIRLSGLSELPVTWQEPVFMTDSRTVTCRAMFDHVIMGQGVIYDLKKISSAHPEKCAKRTSELGYDIQHAAYCSALRALRPDMAGREDFVFLFAEIEPPYAVNPVRLDGQFKRMGQFRWDRAVKLWDDCMRSGSWPGFSQGISSVSPTSWAIRSAMEMGMEYDESL